MPSTPSTAGRRGRGAGVWTGGGADGTTSTMMVVPVVPDIDLLAGRSHFVRCNGPTGRRRRPTVEQPATASARNGPASVRRNAVGLPFGPWLPRRRMDAVAAGRLGLVHRAVG